MRTNVYYLLRGESRPIRCGCGPAYNFNLAKRNWVAAATPHKNGRWTIHVGLGGVSGDARIKHMAFVKWLIRTLDHEYAHALGGADTNLDYYLAEVIANRFERAGAWARR